MKRITTLATVAGLAVVPSGEAKIDIFDQAAHIPSPVCRQELETEFTDHELLELIHTDTQLSIAADERTSRDNAARVSAEDLADAPTIDEYIQERVSQTGQYLLEKSGIEITTFSDRQIGIDPAKLESILEQSYRVTIDDSPRKSKNILAQHSDDCLADDIFLRRQAEGLQIEMIFIGYGDKCIAKKRVVSNYNPSCATGGRQSGNRIFVAMPYKEGTSQDRRVMSTVVHELDHLLRIKLGVRPDSSKKNEYVAQTAGETAFLLFPRPEFIGTIVSTTAQKL